MLCKYWYCYVLGGSGEIRTHGRVAPTAVFKTAALNRSATLPFSLLLDDKMTRVSFRSGNDGLGRMNKGHTNHKNLQQVCYDPT